MEGSYSKVLKAREAVPSETYNFFMDILMETVRNEIAHCLQAAYRHLHVSDAQKLLAFSSPAQVKTFAEEHQWKISGDQILFKVDGEVKAAVPTIKLIKKSLRYARELEKIV